VEASPFGTTGIRGDVSGGALDYRQADQADACRSLMDVSFTLTAQR
jgi:hypothetical protein